MSKYYFSDNDEEMCYTIEAHKDQMRFNKEAERIVYKAIKSSEKGYFYCKSLGEIGERPPSGEPCGKECIMYIPRNGISGCCKSFRTLYACSDEQKIIKLK